MSTFTRRASRRGCNLPGLADWLGVDVRHHSAQALSSSRREGYPQQAYGSVRDAAKLLRGSMLYAMRIDGLIKIGWTSMMLTDRRDRFRAEMGAVEIEILAFIPGTREDELEIHHLLADHVVKGREWYNPTVEVMAVVNEWRAYWGRDPIAA